MAVATPRTRNKVSEFAGKADLIYGAAGGIGRATAVAFGRESASVVVTDLESMRDDALETVELVEKAESSGGAA
jgi:NAD(P)-dependent dehydrogenase (short-subunit alcohol dehydrogenase family)